MGCQAACVQRYFSVFLYITLMFLVLTSGTCQNQLLPGEVALFLITQLEDAGFYGLVWSSPGQLGTYSYYPLHRHGPPQAT